MKYGKEIVAVLLGLAILSVVLYLSDAAKKEAEANKQTRDRELAAAFAKQREKASKIEPVKTKFIKEEPKEEAKEPTPSSFSSYVVSVRIDLKEKTPIEDAIGKTEKAMSLLRTSPTIKDIKIISGSGLVVDQDGKQKLFEIDTGK
jgi:hypothetical protein